MNWFQSLSGIWCGPDMELYDARSGGPFRFNPSQGFGVVRTRYQRWSGDAGYHVSIPLRDLVWSGLGSPRATPATSIGCFNPSQ